MHSLGVSKLSTENPEPHPYQGRQIVLTTKHGKLDLIAPILAAELGLEAVLHEADTDLLGTFSGEVERTLTASQAAITKARIGTTNLGLSLGIASEGTIGPDRLLPFLRSDTEYIALVDLDLGIELVEEFRSLEIIAGEMVTEPGLDISEFLERVDFPNHRLIASPNIGERSKSLKGLSDRKDLETAVNQVAKESKDGKVLLQSDLRAHCSPSRQENIRQAVRILAQRLKSLCPSCKCPGWGKVGYEKGLDCSACGEYVEKAFRAEVLGCAKCSHREVKDSGESKADPSICDGCNP
jgi:hypothetical protein